MRLKLESLDVLSRPGRRLRWQVAVGEVGSAEPRAVGGVGGFESGFVKHGTRRRSTPVWRCGGDGVTCVSVVTLVCVERLGKGPAVVHRWRPHGHGAPASHGGAGERF